MQSLRPLVDVCLRALDPAQPSSPTPNSSCYRAPPRTKSGQILGRQYPQQPGGVLRRGPPAVKHEAEDNASGQEMGVRAVQ